MKNDKKNTPVDATATGAYESVDSSRIDFFQFDEQHNSQFEGRYIKEKKIRPGVSGFLFEDLQGKKHLLPTHEAISNAIDEKGVGFYLITYKGESDIGNGKTLKAYDIKFKKK